MGAPEAVNDAFIVCEANKRLLFHGHYMFFYKNTWFEFQPAVSYFSVYFQPKVFLILFLIFVFEFPE